MNMNTFVNMQYIPVYLYYIHIQIYVDCRHFPVVYPTSAEQATTPTLICFPMGESERNLILKQPRTGII